MIDEYERNVKEEGFQCIAGVDEAGRGPLAGPVIAAAVHIPFDLEIEGINDSKKLTPQKRKEMYELFCAHERIHIGIGRVDSDVIDRVNILQASLTAMLHAVQELSITPDHLLVDGHISPRTHLATTPLVGGDAKSRLIGAASIVAKHVRDQIMLEYHAKWPEYGFDTHMGYGTKKHLEALERCGVLPIHRVSFAPIKTALARQHVSMPLAVVAPEGVSPTAP